MEGGFQAAVALLCPLVCLYPLCCPKFFFSSLDGPFLTLFPFNFSSFSFIPLFSFPLSFPSFLLLFFSRVSLLRRFVRLFLFLLFFSECFIFVLYLVRISCDHGRIPGGSVEVRQP